MSILVAGFLLCSAAGCADPTDPVPAPPDLTITTTGECARISFQITGSSSVTTWYPSAACTVGLVVIRSAGASTWNGSTRTLTLKLRVANTSTEPVTLPVRLELPVEGKTVTLPEGISPDSLVPLDMDSTLAADRKLWLVGGTGTLAPGDSSETRTLTFQVKAPVTKGRFWFVSSGEEVPTVPAAAPGTNPAWFVDDTSWTAAPSLKRVARVQFADGATLSQRQAAVDSVDGMVVGGFRPLPGRVEGTYYIYIPTADTDSALMAAIFTLARQPGVRHAGFFYQPRVNSRRPNDGIGWAAADWRVMPDSSDGENWNYEELAFPLAWGCQPAALSTRVGVLEKRILGGEFQPNARPYSPSIPLPSGQFEEAHGITVANLLAAPGNDGQGRTGALWQAAIDIVTLGPTFAKPLINVPLEYALDSLVRLGSQVINISLGAARGTTPAQDSSFQADFARDVVDGLTVSGSDSSLVVVSAGNDNDTLAVRGTGIAAADPRISQRVLVVGGSGPRSDQDLTWASGTWSIGAPAPSPPEPPSGTWFSIDGLTHDGDSLAYPGGGFLGGGTHTVNVRLGNGHELGAPPRLDDGDAGGPRHLHAHPPGPGLDGDLDHDRQRAGQPHRIGVHRDVSQSPE